MDGRRFADGMAASIIPTEVVVDHGGDTVMACNCIPGPNRTNPLAKYALGRAAYETVAGRLIDAWTWTNFLTQNASTAYGSGSDVYFEFNLENISTLEPMQWKNSRSIYEDAKKEGEYINEKIDELIAVWERKQCVTSHC